MAELTLHYPDDLLLASGKTRSALEDQLRFELAVRLFEVGQLSLGKAAELAGLSKPRFGEELGRLKIPTINLDDPEIDAELSTLRNSHHLG
jgi:predicted HTH domain antitoxin